MDDNEQLNEIFRKRTEAHNREEALRSSARLLEVVNGKGDYTDEQRLEACEILIMWGEMVAKIKKLMPDE
jgi:hypothetical protein